MYDKQNGPIRYSWGPVTLTNSPVFAVVGPNGKAGTLLDYGIDGITTTTAGATNLPKLEVGNATTANLYGANWTTPAVTAPGATSIASLFNRLTDPTDFYTYIQQNVAIAAGTVVLLTVTAAAGGGAGGVGTPFMVIQWDD